MPRPKACVVYVGDLPSDIRTREVEDVFYKVRHAYFGHISANCEPMRCVLWYYFMLQFGRILNIDIKGGERGRAFAFVEFDHPRYILLSPCVGHLRW